MSKLRKTLPRICLLALLIVPGVLFAQRSDLRPTPGTPGTPRNPPQQSAPDSARPTQPAPPTRQPTHTRSGGSNPPALTPPASLPTFDLAGSSDEASQAITQFNSDQLGASIDLLYAGASSAEIQTALEYLPADIQAMMTSATSISGATYWGLLSNGATMVAVGDCSTNPQNCAISVDTLSVQLSSAAAGVYSLLTTQPAVTTAQAALSLVTTTFPKVNGLQFTQITEIDQGFAFSAITSTVGYNLQTKQPSAVTKIVYAGVVNINGKALIYAFVGIGEGYVNLSEK